MTVWTPRLAKVRVPGAGRGTGWALGATGILTTRDAVAAALSGETDVRETTKASSAAPPPTAEVIIGADPSRAFDAAVLWDDESVNLAILQVCATQRGDWRTLLGHEPDPVLTNPGTETVTGSCVIGFDHRATNAEGESNVSWMLSQPLEAQGSLRSDVMRADHATFDIETSVTDKAARRLLAGAVALRYRPEPLLLGLVTGRSRGRKHYFISTLPDPMTTPDLAAALRRIGVPPVVHSIDGPVLRSFLTAHSVDPAGRPVRMRNVTSPEWFGVHRARSDLTPPDDSYFPFIDRPEARQLRTALDAALDGAGPRCLLVTGQPTAGTSRLVAHTLLQHPRLYDHNLLAPATGRRIEDLPRSLRRGPLIIWFDGLDQYPVTALSPSSVRRLMDDNHETLIIGTYTHPAPPIPGDDDAATPTVDLSGAIDTLSGVRALLDDPTVAIVIDVADLPDLAALPDEAGADADTGAPETNADSDTTQAVIDAARDRQGSLGHYLAAGQELADHYEMLSGPARILVDIVAEWDRSGVCRTLDADTARSLWARCVPLRLAQQEAREFARMSDTAFTDHWLAAIRDATRTILGSGRLITHASHGFASTSLGREQSAAVPIHSQVWDYILKQYPSTPPARLTMGIRALEAGTPQRALRAFESILFFRDDDAGDPATATLVDVIARRGIALYLSQLGQTSRAIAVYTDLVDTVGHSDDPAVRAHLAQALTGIAAAFVAGGSDGQAISAYQELDEQYGSDHDPSVRRTVAAGLAAQATLLERSNREDEATDIYTEITKRYGKDTDATLGEIVDTAEQRLQRQR